MSLLWICDVNGVLVDTTAVVRNAFAATAQHFGFRFNESDFQRVKGFWLLEAYRRLDPAHDPFITRRHHLRRIRERLSEVRSYPGVQDVLAEAQARQIRVAATTSHGEFAEACLIETGLYPYIDCLVTQEEVKRPKPHPDAILRIMDLFNVVTHRADAAMYLGDTTADIQAGKAAGIRTIGVTYGVSSEAEIRAALPDYVIYSFDEMRGFITTSPTAVHPPTGASNCLTRMNGSETVEPADV